MRTLHRSTVYIYICVCVWIGENERTREKIQTYHRAMRSLHASLRIKVLLFIFLYLFFTHISLFQFFFFFEKVKIISLINYVLMYRFFDASSNKLTFYKKWNQKKNRKSNRSLNEIRHYHLHNIVFDCKRCNHSKMSVKKREIVSWVHTMFILRYA